MLSLRYGVVLSVLGTALLSQCQTPDNAVVGATIVNTADSPLKIASMTQTTSILFSEVKVLNVSNRSIASFITGSIPVISKTCGREASVGNVEIEINEMPELAPTDEYTAHPRGRDLGPILNFGKIHGAAAVHVQFAIVHVQFTDGGTWDRKLDGDVYDTNLMEKEGDLACAGGQLKSQQVDCSPEHRSMNLEFSPYQATLHAGTSAISKNISSASFYIRTQCAATINPVTCTNSPNSQSCTNTVCTDVYNCAFQYCEVCPTTGPCRGPK